MVGFASNHDAFAGQRLFDQLGGDPTSLRMAAATYLLQTNRPFIYYGEEIGMSGASGLSGDRKLRTPMSWTSASAGFTSGTPFRALAGNVAIANVAAERDDANSLLNFYRAVIALRQSRPSLQRGAYGEATARGALMTFSRTLGNEKTIVVFNYGSAAGVVNLTGFAGGAVLHRLWPVGMQDLLVDGAGSVNVEQAARSFAVFGVDL
jgi:glycosidase